MAVCKTLRFTSIVIVFFFVFLGGEWKSFILPNSPTVTLQLEIITKTYARHWSQMAYSKSGKSVLCTRKSTYTHIP